MSAQIDTIFDQLSAASNQKNSQAKGTKGTGDSVVFADLLQDSLPSNITFTRPGSQFSLPEGAQTEEFDYANNDIQPYENDTASEADDNSDDYDQYAEDDAPDRQDNTESDDPHHNEANPHANGLVAANVNDQSATAGSDDAALNASQTSGQAGAAEKSGAQNAQAAGQKADQAAKGTQGDMTPAETADIDPATLKKQQANNSGIKATITDKNDPLTSQPNSVLSANSAVAAQSTQSSATADTTTVADMLLETTEEAALMNTGGSENDAKGKNGSNNNNAGQNSANTQTTAQANATPSSNDAAATTASPTTPNANATATNATAGNPGAAQAAAPMAAEAPSSVFGNPGQIASVHSASGGMVIEGQNGQTTQKAAAPAQATPQSRPNIPPQLVSDQVSVNIQRAAGQGQDKISIQLRPYELGKIDVTMELAKDGKMTAVITAEKQETLDMLKGDSSSLIQSLNDAGMQTDSSSLSFSLDDKGSAFGQFANGSDDKQSPEKEFSLDGDEAEENEGETSNMLGLGEEAQADENGHYDIQV